MGRHGKATEDHRYRDRAYGVGGENSTLPEDVGGASGYEEFLEALFDTSHEEHELMKLWGGRPFHPTVFSVDDANDAAAQKS